MWTTLHQRLHESLSTLLTLIASTGTLVCCALPILLVTLGLGSAVVGLTSAFPWLVTLSQHKIWVFLFSGGLLLISGWLLYRPGRSCPTDPELAARCVRLDHWNRIIYGLTVSIWTVGLFMAYLLLPTMQLLGIV